MPKQIFLSVRLGTYFELAAMSLNLIACLILKKSVTVRIMRYFNNTLYAMKLTILICF